MDQAQGDRLIDGMGTTIQEEEMEILLAVSQRVKEMPDGEDQSSVGGE